MEEYENILRRFMKEMNSNQSLDKTGTQDSPDWSLGELENIVYDFVDWINMN